MTQNNSGGPAFPTSNGGSPDDGMTLRDYFAAKAMRLAYDYVRRIDPNGRPLSVSESEHALNTYVFQWDEDGGSDCDMVAEFAYSMADAMLKARTA
jgi:hypothetical protein